MFKVSSYKQFVSYVVVAVVSSLLILSIYGLATRVSAGGQTACGKAPPGYNVIISNKAKIRGTTRGDFICAGNKSNIIKARGGNDIVYGRGGNDKISGGGGSDKIFAGAGSDTLNTDSDNQVDVFYGENGPDKICCGPGSRIPDVALGGPGNDKITLWHGYALGGPGNDKISIPIAGYGAGGAGEDELVGNEDSNEPPNAILVGDSGNDIFTGNFDFISPGPSANLGVR